MNPNEKAIELVSKYSNLIIHFPYFDSVDGSCIDSGYMTYNSAIDCALIEVKEIQAQIKQWGIVSVKTYWNQVKTELNNMKL